MLSVTVHGPQNEVGMEVVRFEEADPVSPAHVAQQMQPLSLGPDLLAVGSEVLDELMLAGVQARRGNGYGLLPARDQEWQVEMVVHGDCVERRLLRDGFWGERSASRLDHLADHFDPTPQLVRVTLIGGDNDSVSLSLLAVPHHPGEVAVVRSKITVLQVFGFPGLAAGSPIPRHVFL